MKSPKCRRCGSENNQRVIYAGFPLWLCRDEDCSLVWGFWSFIFTFMPFNGWFFCYEGMNYFTAMCYWLQGKEVG